MKNKLLKSMFVGAILTLPLVKPALSLNNTSYPLNGEIIIRTGVANSKDTECLGTLFEVIKDIETVKEGKWYKPRIAGLGTYYGAFDGTGSEYINFTLGVPYDLDDPFANSMGNDNVMNSLELQKGWANTLSKSCPQLVIVSFGLDSTDWINDFYLEEQGKMKNFSPSEIPLWAKKYKQY